MRRADQSTAPRPWEKGPRYGFYLIFPAIASLALAGCAPTRFETAVQQVADEYHVTDAAARRVANNPDLRFDALLMSDLEEALSVNGDEPAARERAADVIRGANDLGTAAALGEIDRLPDAGVRTLAERAAISPDRAVLKETYREQARAALDTRLAELQSVPIRRVCHKLRAIRSRIELAPDDRDRLLRQTALAWAAAPAWIGLKMNEDRIENDRKARLGRRSDRVLRFDPPLTGHTSDELLAKYAPIIVQEWPDKRSYPEQVDRFGRVVLSGTPGQIEVGIAGGEPTVYAYASQAKISGRRIPQVVYVWWYPERPELEANDVAAGRIDGQTVRITLDRYDRPAIFEAVQSCGCHHLVFVADHVEAAARQQFGEPLPGKDYSVEQVAEGKRPLMVAGMVHVEQATTRTVVFATAGYHDVSRFACIAPGREPPDSGSAIETGRYVLHDYDQLDRLPLGNGVASMFGPDGLVHNAGRKKGVLLAPTGIMSAGQPRKRGTQKVRWDDYSFDDPHLLERLMRLPAGVF